jgi:surfactin synthase thioesterase subunit
MNSKSTATVQSPAAPLRLFCFHHAGGTTSAFFGWQRRLGAQAQIVPVQLPEHCGRMSSLVAAVDAQIGPSLQAPHLFYGHSMGALIAYHLVRLRRARGCPLPERLLVGAYPAPNVPHRLSQVPDWPDEDVLKLLLGIGGLSPLLSQAPGRTSPTISRLRSHLGLCGSGHLNGDDDPLPCPIEVFAGTDDPLVTVPEAAGWSRYTRAQCRLHRIPGGHFFTRESKPEFFSQLSAVIADTERNLSPTRHLLVDPAVNLRPAPSN